MRKPNAKAKIIDPAQLTISALEKLIESGEVQGIEAATSAIRNLLDCIRPMIRKHPEAGFFVYKTAQRLTRDVSEMAQEKSPPAWLGAIASTEYEVPWLITNGKPVGFKESDSVLSWGRDIIKRGKQQFVAPQTRHVADIIQFINNDREIFRIWPERITKRSEHYSEAPEIIKRNRRIAALPVLSRKTKDQWWPIVKGFIRNKEYLTAQEWNNIKKATQYHTLSDTMNEYIKRCIKAFESLCPNG